MIDDVYSQNSESGMELVTDEPVEVTELNGRPIVPYIPPPKLPLLTASVCATHADGSIGRIGSWAGGVI